MKSFLVICLAALMGSTFGFAPMSSFTANQMSVTRGSSMLSMSADEKTYIMWVSMANPNCWNDNPDTQPLAFFSQIQDQARWSPSKCLCSPCRKWKTWILQNLSVSVESSETSSADSNKRDTSCAPWRLSKPLRSFWRNTTRTLSKSHSSPSWETTCSGRF